MKRSKFASTCNTRLDPADVIRFCRAVEPYHPFFIEDPIRSENAASFHHLRRHVSVPARRGRAVRQQVGVPRVDRKRPD